MEIIDLIEFAFIVALEVTVAALVGVPLYTALQRRYAAQDDQETLRVLFVHEERIEELEERVAELEDDDE